MNKPLYVAFLWHMHQPMYKDTVTSMYLLPWVRLHGIKDYYDMVAILESYPKIHQTFNLVPSLMIQIEEYVNHEAIDKHLFYTLIPAEKLTRGQKLFLLQEFFSANWDNMIKVFPRYRELLEKRGITAAFDGLIHAIDKFDTQDFLDLQVWFNIAWFDPYFQGKDELLVNLIKKQKNFTEEDKHAIIAKQREVLSKIIPEYKKMQDKGQIEVAVGPYYHPILPLLCNTDIAKESVQDISLPEYRLIAPEDAQAQIEKAICCYQDYFGMPPKGMWPSEGGVCNEIIPIIADAGITWLATDEWILYNTIGIKEHVPYILYKPYKVEINGRRISIVFRDRELSDMIGFNYWKWNTYDAVSDFITRLHHIKDILPAKRNHIICIAMDGENAWEYYSKDGWEFLEYLYTCLSKDDRIRTVTISEYLEENPAQEILTELYPGSWINSNFNIWIGDTEENKAWEYLYETREVLINFEKTNGRNDKTMKAWEYIYIAEGSDWFWWYGDEHYTPTSDIFDELFRKYLIEVYKILELDVPAKLKLPIKTT
jgi:alpha-amylase/alpha-mannosidase (GH57 family)